MCDCIEKIEKNVVTRYEKEHPTANSVKADVKNYTFCMGANITVKGFFDLHLIASHPLKSGEFKQKKSKTRLIFTFCPFCGVKYDDEY